MRKYLLVILIMLQFQMLFGQDDSKFIKTSGVILGSGISTFHSELKSTLFQPKPVMYVGFFMGREYSKFGHLTKLEYERKGARKHDGNFNYSLHYITLEPGMLIKSKPVHFMLGPFASALVSKKVTTDIDKASFYTESGFKTFDFGAFIGLQSYLFQFSGNTVQANLQTNYSFTNISNRALIYESKWERNLSIKAGFSVILK